VRCVGAWLALLAVVGCRPDDSSKTKATEQQTITERSARLASALADSGLGAHDAPLARWLLPASFAEISGMALTADGRLLIHGDERGRVAEVDFRTGRIVKSFTVGEPMLHGDFEAIAIVGDTVVLLTSNGKLVSFREGADGAVVPATTRDTGLGKVCEFEAMAHDTTTHSLVLACKQLRGKDAPDAVVLYRVALTGGAAPVRIEVPMAAIQAGTDWKGFHPSDLTIDPATGQLLLVASQEHGLVALNPDGNLIFARDLPSGHAQPEALAITPDGMLLIGDEAKGSPASITLYRWP
jgi:uncharacterized protein YjiK